MPVLAVVFPRNESDLSTWTINGIGKVLCLVFTISTLQKFDRTCAKRSKKELFLIYFVHISCRLGSVFL